MRNEQGGHSGGRCLWHSLFPILIQKGLVGDMVTIVLLVDDRKLEPAPHLRVATSMRN